MQTYRRPWWRVSVRPSMQQALGCRSAPSWRWPLASPASEHMPAAGSSSAACSRAAASSGRGARVVAAVRPGAGPPGGRRRSRLGQRRGLGVRRRAPRPRPSCSALGPRIRRLDGAARQLRERARRPARLPASSAGRRLPGSDERRRRIGNEVLDAMPVDLLHFDGTAWFERGVARGEGERAPVPQRLADCA